MAGYLDHPSVLKAVQADSDRECPASHLSGKKYGFIILSTTSVPELRPQEEVGDTDSSMPQQHNEMWMFTPLDL